MTQKSRSGATNPVTLSRKKVSKLERFGVKVSKLERFGERTILSSLVLLYTQEEYRRDKGISLKAMS